jgi:zinc-binding alcohol dehydrogenase/oxidoreductase
MGSRSELYSVLDLVARELVKPVIDEVMPLAQVRRAHEKLERREQFGKIVLRVDLGVRDT